jgi:hypothetical protein
MPREPSKKSRRLATAPPIHAIKSSCDLENTLLVSLIAPNRPPGNWARYGQ